MHLLGTFCCILLSFSSEPSELHTHPCTGLYAHITYRKSHLPYPRAPLQPVVHLFLSKSQSRVTHSHSLACLCLFSLLCSRMFFPRFIFCFSFVPLTQKVSRPVALWTVPHLGLGLSLSGERFLCDLLPAPGTCRAIRPVCVRIFSPAECSQRR